MAVSFKFMWEFFLTYKLLLMKRKEKPLKWNTKFIWFPLYIYKPHIHAFFFVYSASLSSSSVSPFFRFWIHLFLLLLFFTGNFTFLNGVSFFFHHLCLNLIPFFKFLSNSCLHAGVSELGFCFHSDALHSTF